MSFKINRIRLIAIVAIIALVLTGFFAYELQRLRLHQGVYLAYFDSVGDDSLPRYPMFIQFTNLGTEPIFNLTVNFQGRTEVFGILNSFDTVKFIEANSEGDIHRGQGDFTVSYQDSHGCVYSSIHPTDRWASY